mmetsp:Transcript_14221/g.18494  ORF Transcript_14221/g.18494 Transcript_14221/m.18494 type:complete len:216 (-) Transcript_14221:143-790(-)
MSGAKLSDGLKQVEKIVDRLYQRQDSFPFREPVQWKELGLVDYPTLVKKPMALSDVQSKLKAGQYRTPAEAAEDINLIWSNCTDYNMDGSDFYKLALKFKQRFETEFAKVKIDETPESQPEREPSLEDKTQFAHNIYMIKCEELGEVITKLDQMCPSALEKTEGKDEIQVNIDAIDGKTFHKLNDIVKAYLPEVKKSKKAKKSDGAGGASKKQKN